MKRSGAEELSDISEDILLEIRSRQQVSEAALYAP